jgi:F0F1-type ATP synthase assembly protein I
MEEERLSPKPRKKSIWVTAGEYSALGFILPSCVVAGWLIGGWLDQQFGTTYLTLIFIIFGIVGGFIQIFRFLNRKDG